MNDLFEKTKDMQRKVNSFNYFVVYDEFHVDGISYKPGDVLFVSEKFGEYTLFTADMKALMTVDAEGLTMSGALVSKYDNPSLVSYLNRTIKGLGNVGNPMQVLFSDYATAENIGSVTVTETILRADQYSFTDGIYAISDIPPGEYVLFPNRVTYRTLFIMCNKNWDEKMDVSPVAVCTMEWLSSKVNLHLTNPTGFEPVVAPRVYEPFTFSIMRLFSNKKAVYDKNGFAYRSMRAVYCELQRKCSNIAEFEIEWKSMLMDLLLSGEISHNYYDQVREHFICQCIEQNSLDIEIAYEVVCYALSKASEMELYDIYMPILIKSGFEYIDPVVADEAVC